MQHSLLRGCATAMAAALLLAACGGGGDGGGSGGNNGGNSASEVPASAQASVSGLIAYMRELVASASDTARPVFLGNAVLPVDDKAEPTPLR
jgi:hypothetical protein